MKPSSMPSLMSSACKGSHPRADRRSSLRRWTRPKEKSLIWILGASWGGDETIIYAEPNVLGLQRVSSAGGPPKFITQVDSTKGEIAHLDLRGELGRR